MSLWAKDDKNPDLAITRDCMENVRVSPGKAVSVGDISVENKTSNSIIVRYDKARKAVLLVDCCLEEQGK